MNIQMSFVLLGFVALGAVGLFLIIKSFYLPKTYYTNQVKREQLIKERIVSIMYDSETEAGSSGEEEMNEEEEMAPVG